MLLYCWELEEVSCGYHFGSDNEYFVDIVQLNKYHFNKLNRKKSLQKEMRFKEDWMKTYT